MPRVTKITVREGTTAEWAAADAASGADPTRLLDAGEPGRDTTLNLLKFGDGVSAWAALPPAQSGTYGEIAGANVFTGVNKAKVLNEVRFASLFSGADNGAKINAAIADLPARGGIVDCSGFTTAYTFTTKVVIDKPVRLLLPEVTHTYTGPGSAYRIAAHGVFLRVAHRASGGTGDTTTLIWQPNDYVAPATPAEAMGAVEFVTLPSGGGTTVPIHCDIEDLYIDARSNSGQCGIRWLASYSRCKNVTIAISGFVNSIDGPASGVLVLGHDEGAVNTRGTGSYYNEFKVNVSGSLSASATDEVGIRYDIQNGALFNTTYPNANVTIGGRLAALRTGVLARGNANRFYAITSESIRSEHYLVDGPVANATTRVVIDTPYMEGASGSNGVTVQGLALSTVLRDEYASSLGAGVAWNDTTPSTQNNARHSGARHSRVLLGAAVAPVGGSTSVFEARNAESGNRTGIELHTVDQNIIRWLVRAAGGSGIVEFSRDASLGEYRFRAPLSFRDSTSVTGFQNETDATRKTFYYNAAPYLNAEEAVVGVCIDAASTSTIVKIGGTDAPGSFNAATAIQFFTGSAINTLSGTLRWNINTNGIFYPQVDNTYDVGFSRSTFRVRDVHLARNLTIGGALDHYGSTAGFFGTAPITKPSAYTQTFATADKTHAARVATAVATTAATSITPFGYSTQAQADDIVTQINNLRSDQLDSAQLLNSLIDDLQAIGLVG